MGGKLTGEKRVPWSTAYKTAEKIHEVMEKYDIRHLFCGSYRRTTLDIGDLDMIVVGALSPIVNTVQLDPLFRETLQSLQSAKMKTAQWIVDGMQLDMYGVAEESFGSMALFLTGSQKFNIIVRGEAKRQGYKLNQYGLWQGDERIAGKSEEQIFDALGLKYVRPIYRSVESFKRLERA